MEFALSIFTIACWCFTAVGMTYNVRTLWRPLPHSFKEIPELRREALRATRESNRIAFDKVLDETIIKRRKSVEYLRLYVRFLDKYNAVDINVIISRIRMHRTKLQTNLTPSKITAEQFTLFRRFEDVKLGVLPFVDGIPPKKRQKQRRAFERTTIYALGHMSVAEDIFSIVEQRGVYDLKQVKPLLKDIKSVPTGALSDGTL